MKTQLATGLAPRPSLPARLLLVCMASIGMQAGAEEANKPGARFPESKLDQLPYSISADRRCQARPLRPLLHLIFTRQLRGEAFRRFDQIHQPSAAPRHLRRGDREHEGNSPKKRHRCSRRLSNQGDGTTDRRRAKLGFPAKRSAQRGQDKLLRTLHQFVA